ncbi:diacylglycerol acyltransferase-domain-containing protein [Dunaliella salina]|uniref:Acyltransferase n=1 Tax=Dunaliella salina TaxID=3046 RepID=A0ABQ7G2W1_DUNSA|nr:diacylglycerol acyltransferase-domain-containing protein [Dunaliella salina]|eukprot:KAF5828936.1 diacylglycerol acyltransferase-domain-containing protein [Dunaliella salina]
MNPLIVPLLGIYVGSIQLALILPAFAAYRVYQYGILDSVGLSIILVLAVATFTPLFTSKWTDKLIALTTSGCAEHCPFTVVHEDEEALKPGTSYVFGFEPHSALPIGIPTTFSVNSPLVPKAVRGSVYGMASSVCFVVPFVRHLWWWIGLRPASRSLIDRMLSNKISVVICPGGVRECLTMEPGLETVYLRKRQGFVRMALKHGAPLVPVFALGQSKTYSWWRPPGVDWISRKFQAVPLLMWGALGTPVPHRSPVKVVIGKPIQVPKVEEPSSEQVDHYLQTFISELSALFERHNEASKTQLRIL